MKPLTACVLVIVLAVIVWLLWPAEATHMNAQLSWVPQCSVTSIDYVEIPLSSDDITEAASTLSGRGWSNLRAVWEDDGYVLQATCGL